jgi:hypothetical protein
MLKTWRVDRSGRVTGFSEVNQIWAKIWHSHYVVTGPGSARVLRVARELFECLVEEEHEVLQEAAELSAS